MFRNPVGIATRPIAVSEEGVKIPFLKVRSISMRSALRLT